MLPLQITLPEMYNEIITLYLPDKPSPPGGPLKVSDVHAEGCKLNWNPPADDGGQPIEKYIVEKMDEASGNISQMKLKL
jgi:hypothetical protein